MKTKLLYFFALIASFSFSQIGTESAFYNFNGNLNDDISNGDLTDSNGIQPTVSFTNDRFGIGNSAFDSSGENLIGYTTNATKNRLTLSFWVKPDQASGSYQQVVDFRDSTNDGVIVQLATGINAMRVYFVNAGITRTGVGSVTLNDGNWHHIVIRIQKQSSGYITDVFFDAIKQTGISNGINPNPNFPVGSQDFIASGASLILSRFTPYTGEIDELRVYVDSGITDTDINTIYQQSAPCIVNIPDTNLKAALLAHGTTITGTNVSVIDSNGDGEIQCSEASSYTGRLILNSNNAGPISDATGIEEFVSTPYILLSGQSLTTLDVSNNLQLINLDVSLNNLTTLDITQNTNLEVLSLFHNNISTLDVSQNMLLFSLDIANNNFSSIDLSQNTNLDFLYVSSNINLTSLDLTANTNLYGLSASTTGLLSLDLTTNAGLGELFINFNNNLSNLNIANGTNNSIIQAEFVSNPNLSCIQIDNGFFPPSTWQKDAAANYSNNCSLSINDFVVFDFNLYPNPTTSILNIETNAIIEEVTIYSILGKTVKTLIGTNKINVSDLKAGIYFVRITSETGDLTKRFIKQ